MLQLGWKDVVVLNAGRRKSLAVAMDHLREASNIVDRIKDEEQDSLDNMPENLQESERYSNMEEAVDALDDALTAINEASDYVENAMNH